MKILKLIAQNFKKLSAVEITPDGNMVVISGKNGAGKSSILDAIEAALCGGKMAKKPIKEGEIRAKIEVDMGEYKVTRKFFGTTSTLTVETTGETKAKISSPQAFLDSVVGNLSFDPLAFLNKQPAEQRNTLMEFLGLNLNEYTKKIDDFKISRSDIRREKERKLHEAESLVFTPNLPPQEVSSESLLGELKGITDHNQWCQEMETKSAVVKTQLESNAGFIAAAQAAVESWQKKLLSLQQQKSQLEKQFTHLNPTTKDSTEVEAKLKSLSATNEAIRTNVQRETAMIAYHNCEGRYIMFGDEIKVIENQKARKLAEVVMPVRGLTILSDGLAYGGIPLEQVNAAKQLEICVSISMAMNPKLKVLRINGNDLDIESLLAIGRIVDNQGYQIWIEKVSDDDKIGFYIEDGHLVGEVPCCDSPGADKCDQCQETGLVNPLNQG